MAHLEGETTRLDPLASEQIANCLQKSQFQDHQLTNGARSSRPDRNYRVGIVSCEVWIEAASRAFQVRASAFSSLDRGVWSEDRGIRGH